MISIDEIALFCFYLNVKIKIKTLNAFVFEIKFS